MNSLYSTCTSSFFHHCFVYESLDFICACVDDRLSIDVDEKNNLDDNNDVDNDRYNNKDGKNGVNEGTSNNNNINSDDKSKSYLAFYLSASLFSTSLPHVI